MVRGVAATRKAALESLKAAEDSSESAASARVALDELTEAKREANQKYLARLGKALWIVTTVVVAGVLITVYGHNHQPQAAVAADQAAKDLAAQAATISDRIADGASEDAVAQGVAKAQQTADALATAVDGLPSTWNGEDMAAQSLAAQASVQRINDDLIVVDSYVQAGQSQDSSQAQEALASIGEQAEVIEDLDLSPGSTNPWDFEDPNATGVFYGTVVAYVLLVGVGLLVSGGGGLRWFLIGGDGRISTAQTQAAIWTVAVLFIALVLLLRPSPGEFDELDENYLLMLGGPFTALVIGGAVARGKIQANEVQKSDSEEAQVRDIFCNDSGRPELVDTQFFLFSMAALVGVVFAFWQSPDSVPPINTGLAMLSGGGALVYVGKKALDSNAPLITSVTPGGTGERIAEGLDIVIRGANFVPPGTGGDIDALRRLRVEFEKEDGAVISRQVALRTADTDTVSSAADVRRVIRNPLNGRVIATVPDELVPKDKESFECDVRVVTAAGVASPKYAVVIEKRPPS